MNGILMYVMGPSGSGKDSLLAYARHDLSKFYEKTWDCVAKRPPHVLNSVGVGKVQRIRPTLFTRRYITRPSDAGGENHLALTFEQFYEHKAAGYFALNWESHGLCYGISADIDGHLAKGALVVVNGSREYLPVAINKYPKLLPVLVTVRPEVLRVRLERRGREKAEEIEERLEGAGMKLPNIPRLITLDNSEALEVAGQRFVELCNNLRHK